METRTPKTWPLLASETVLPDDYPVFWEYVYIMDGKFRRSDIKGTVRDLKRGMNVSEVRRCELFAREWACLGDFVEIPKEKEGVEKDLVESI